MLHRAAAMRVTALAPVLVLALASPAAAQTEADADVLLREGVAFAEAGEHTRAVAWFERARAITPSDRIDLNLAASLVALGEYRRAEQLLVRLASDATVNPLTGETARDRLAALRERMGIVEVSVRPVPAGAWLSVDGRRVGEARELTEVAVFPGTVQLAVVDESGAVLARARATVEERGRADIELTPARLPVRLPALRVSRPEFRYLRVEVPTASVDPWPWVAGAIGVVVALAAGIGIGAAIWAPEGSDVGAVALGAM